MRKIPAFPGIYQQPFEHEQSVITANRLFTLINAVQKDIILSIICIFRVKHTLQCALPNRNEKWGTVLLGRPMYPQARFCFEEQLARGILLAHGARLAQIRAWSLQRTGAPDLARVRRTYIRTGPDPLQGGRLCGVRWK